MQAAKEEPTYNRTVYEANIRALIDKYYPIIASLDTDTISLIIEQLTWVQQYNQFTPQANVQYNTTFEFNKHLHIETFRALTRIEQFVLVTDSEKNHYQQFVKDQDEKFRLSSKSYEQLKALFRLTKPEQAALIRAILIASVPLSPPALRYCQTHHADKKYPYDSVQFSGFTIAFCPEMYPAYQNTSEEVQQLIRYCFPNDKRHWRHMFYLENQVAFNSLAEAKPQAIESRFWRLYWLVNAFGMNGHVKYTSAVFYEQSVHDRAMWLDQAMQGDLSQCAHQYSGMILSELDVETDPESALLLARILTMTNRIVHSDAEKLLAALEQMPARKLITSTHKAAFDRIDIGVTYLPAMLGNLWSLTRKEQDLISAMHLYSQLALAHNRQDPLSFRLVTKELLQRLMEVKFDINAVKLNDKCEIELDLSYSKQDTLSTESRTDTKTPVLL